MIPADARWWQRLTGPARRLRWRMARWSAGRDREFHDHLFGTQDHDPFSPSYPGYLTVRRFADHAARHVRGVRAAVDLGCGPGEITCELARRHPAVRFTGLDHSHAAIARARGHATRLGLTNAAFDVADIEAFSPNQPVDLVMMFDAFHHLLDPAAFLQRLRSVCPRLFLIEPAGTWLGQWDRRVDLDWIPAAVREIRRRLEHQFGLATSRPVEGSGTPAVPEAGEPTEHRYTLEDLERLFTGYHLEIRGTMAGLEIYGADPHAISPLGDRFGDLTRDLVASLEDTLFSENLDLALKHWAILATRDESGTPVPARVLRRPPSRVPLPPVMPAYGAQYVAYSGPAIVGAREVFQAVVRLTNTGWLTWNSRSAPPVLASYHWEDRQGRVVVEDGRRTPLATVVAPGQSVDAVLRVEAPAAPGRLQLVIDLVHEGVAWFSDEGVVPRREPVTVTSRSGT